MSATSIHRTSPAAHITNPAASTAAAMTARVIIMEPAAYFKYVAGLVRKTSVIMRSDSVIKFVDYEA